LLDVSPDDCCETGTILETRFLLITIQFDSRA